MFDVLVMRALVCSLLARYAMAGSEVRNVSLQFLAFMIMMAGTVYIIFDLDYPRFGIIRLDFADQGLLDLLAGME
jgi:hypothetical protein